MIPFSPPYIRQEAIDEVVDTLKSGWITTGPKTKRFEKEITQYCGCKSTLCVNSATFGLELVLRWYGVKEGDEVIIPAYTYAATANVIAHTGAIPVMVDVMPGDFNMNQAEVKKVISKKTKVVIPVDIAGYPCDMDNLIALVEQNSSLFIAENEIQEKLGRILVLSDSAHSFGALYKNQKIGGQADITVFSFHAVKNLTTAEGGAIAINLPASFDTDDVYKHLNTCSLHGQSKDALAKNKLGGWRYDVVEPGYKGNMTDIQAALGLVSLKYYDTENLPRRKEIFKQYSSAFDNFEWADIPLYQSDLKESSYHIYLLRIKNITESLRDKIIDVIYSKEVSVNVHFQPLPLLTAYKTRGYKIDDYPVAYDNYSRVITLPVNEIITDDEIQKVIDTVVYSVEKVI